VIGGYGGQLPHPRHGEEDLVTGQADAKRAVIDTSAAQPARRYNYWLGGKDHFAADRVSGDEMAAAYPAVRVTAIENRRFLKRATRFLTAECGIRQFLDIGTGLPTADNTHEVAQRIAPESRVVYVDNDPMVMVHARALLTSTPEGRTAYLEDDLRYPESILASADLHETLDLNQPVGLMLVAVLHFVHGDGAAQRVVDKLLDALPSGSYIVASHSTYDLAPAEMVEAWEKLVAAGKVDIWTRQRAEFAALFDGLELVEPGVVPVSQWRDEDEPEPRPALADVAMWSAVARKP
jgi:hypothetical protein